MTDHRQENLTIYLSCLFYIILLKFVIIHLIFIIKHRGNTMVHKSSKTHHCEGPTATWASGMENCTLLITMLPHAPQIAQRTSFRCPPVPECTQN